MCVINPKMARFMPYLSYCSFHLWVFGSNLDVWNITPHMFYYSLNFDACCPGLSSSKMDSWVARAPLGLAKCILCNDEKYGFNIAPPSVVHRRRVSYWMSEVTNESTATPSAAPVHDSLDADARTGVERRMSINYDYGITRAAHAKIDAPPQWSINYAFTGAFRVLEVCALFSSEWHGNRRLKIKIENVRRFMT